MQAFIIYLIITWVSLSVGFVLGAAWSGLGRKNEAVDRLLGRPKACQLVPPTCKWTPQKLDR